MNEAPFFIRVEIKADKFSRDQTVGFAAAT